MRGATRAMRGSHHAEHKKAVRFSAGGFLFF